MKMHTPLFILGLLTFVTPFLGFSSLIENVVISAFGVAIMIIVSTIRVKGDSNSEIATEEILVEETFEESNGEENKEEAPEPTYEEITEEVQDAMTEEDQATKDAEETV